MFDINEMITPTKSDTAHARNNMTVKLKYVGQIVYENDKYQLKYKGVVYNIKKLHRYIGETIYSTHFNNKHEIGTARVLSNDIIDPANLRIINKYWYKIFEGMRVEFSIVNPTVVNIEFEDYAIKRITK